MAHATKGHISMGGARHFKVYTVTNLKDDKIVAENLTAKECAAIMKVSLQYFYELMFYQKQGRQAKWKVESSYVDGINI